MGGDCFLCGQLITSSGLRITTKIRHQNTTYLEVIEKHLHFNVSGSLSQIHVCKGCSVLLTQLLAGEKKASGARAQLRRKRTPVKRKVPFTPKSGKRRMCSTPVREMTTQSGCSSPSSTWTDQNASSSARHTTLVRSPPASGKTQRWLTRVIRREIRTAVNPKIKSSLRGSKNIESFTWQCVKKEAKQRTPLLWKILEIAAKGKKKSIAQVGMAYSILLNASHPRMNSVQITNGIQMWLAGAKRELFRQLNALGVCSSIWTVRRKIDELTIGYDDEVKTWKENVEQKSVQVRRPSRRALFQSPDVAAAPISKPSKSSESVAEGVSATDEGNLGYTLTFDNVNQKTFVHHACQEKSNKQLNMVQAYAARDRVPTMDLDKTLPGSEVISSLPLSIYFPSEDDEAELKEVMIILVQRILAENLIYFNGSPVTQHIKHQFSNAMQEQSRIVPLGIMDKDESKLADMIDIASEYHKYVPIVNEQPVPVLLFGDGLSCERGNDSQEARGNAATPILRLQGLIPSVADWHCRGLILQEWYKSFFHDTSSRSQGTLAYIKQRFNHQNVQETNVLHSFDEAYSLLCFVVASYVTAMGLEYLGLKDVSESPTSLISLCDTAIDVVSNIWMDFKPSHILHHQGQYEFCVCREDLTEETMILCENNKCPRGKWFHLTCMEMEHDDIPKGKWYCCHTCRTGTPGKNDKQIEHIDSKWEYSKGMVWHGLVNMAFHDAIKEGDGLRIMAMWRHFMPLFFEGNHTKYFIHGHKLLTDINGGQSVCIAKQLIHNRTVNTCGGAGKNIPTDLHMEHLNRAYKESIKTTRGQLTAKTIDRHSKILGLTKNLKDNFDREVADRPSYHRRSGGPDRQKDLAVLIKIIRKERLICSILGRYHTSVKNYTFSRDMKNPFAFKTRMVRHQCKRAKRRAKMSIYMMFPVGVFWWFNQPTYFEKWMIEKRKELFPPEDPAVRESIKKTIKLVEDRKQRRLEASLKSETEV